MVATLVNTAASYAIVKRWAAHCKMSKESIEDDGRCGRPTAATTEGNIAHVHRLVRDDRLLFMVG